MHSCACVSSVAGNSNVGGERGCSSSFLVLLKAKELPQETGGGRNDVLGFASPVVISSPAFGGSARLSCDTWIGSECTLS